MPSRLIAALQPVDLALRQQQLTAAARLVIEAVCLQIFRQIGIDQPHLAALIRGVGFGDIGLALAQRLDLGAGQNQTGLVGIDDLVVEAGLAVFRDNLLDHALAALGCHQFISPAWRSAASIAASVAGSSVDISGERTVRLIWRSRLSAYFAPQRPGSMKIALCSGISLS